MELNELQVLQAVAAERSFSRAAVRLHRTQPAVSQAIRRLEDELGERLFDRSSKGGRLTEAGTILLDYAERLTRLTEEAEGAVRELQELRRGRVVIGVNEAAVHMLLPIVVHFREAHPHAQVEMRRVQSRQIPSEVLNRSLDFGLVTFPPGDRGLLSVPPGVDDPSVYRVRSATSIMPNGTDWLKKTEAFLEGFTDLPVESAEARIRMAVR